ncbi:hypothetical protein, variant [Aphanomyces invadans]|uniref:EF-hand domain-containing protein n=1 Tax=Aphanomyces invadans TaxID=157072 RepID=A0A024U2L1_9STRA|nr:hypothetical protein, variant [Aphanomyces invadans]ETW00430.1 hypothetical protein, variant [Aphanomyces invadans]|eukprot:XP_008870565.1 hypothetical protein, variant [Aphanomyces invadans]
MGMLLGKHRYNSDESVELLRETKYFSQWTLADVRELHARFQKTWGFAITESQLESLILLKQPEAVSSKEIFAVLDATRDGKQDGRIDGLEFIGGLTIVCQGTFEERARFAFEVFDFNLNGSLSPIELALLMKSCYSGITVLTGGRLAMVPSIPAFVEVAQQAFSRFDKDESDALNYDEFVSWARSNRDFMIYMEAFRAISESAKERVPEAEWLQEASDDDSDIELECIAPLPLATTSTPSNGHTKPSQPHQYEFEPWMLAEPSNAPAVAAPPRLPPVNLSLEWVYGYRAHDTRNNVRYTASGDIVYFVSRHGIVYNSDRHEQRYYQGHRNEIRCLAMSPTGDKVATGDAGADCAIHVWHPITLECLALLSQFHDTGIGLLAFSNRTDVRLVSVGLDENHRIAVWNWSAKTVLASGIGSTQKALAVALHDNGSELVVAGHKSLEFFTVEHRILKKERASMGTNGLLQGFLSVVFFQQYVIVGTSLGQLYQFQGKQLIRTAQAHPKESVNCLFVSMGSFFSAGKDGTIRQWDTTLQPIGQTVDLSTLNLNMHDYRIATLCYRSDSIHGGYLLVGTRSSVIVEIEEATSVVHRITAFHQTQPCTGLSTTNKRAEFVTCGDDRKIRRWSLRRRQQVHSLALLQLSPGRCIAYSTDAEWVAMGCADGTIVLVDHALTAMHLNFRHASKEIVAIKFALGDRLLAASCANGVIYLYRVNVSSSRMQLTRHALLKPMPNELATPATTLDFSIDGRYLQTQHGSTLRFWDVLCASRVYVMQKIRDVVWHSWESTIGYSIQAFHGAQDQVACVSVNHRRNLVAVVTHDGYVGVSAYPATTMQTLQKQVLGHGRSKRQSHRTSHCGFTRHDSVLITAGSHDRCVCQWTLTREAVDEQPKPVRQVAVHARDSITTTPQYRALDASNSFVLSTESSLQSVRMWTCWAISAKPRREAPDLDLELAWVHGINVTGGTAKLGVTDTGEIVYAAATIGIVFDYCARKQRHFIHHKKNITSVAVHPTGKVAATGSSIEIALWNTTTLKTLGVLPVRAPVMLLAFKASGELLVAVLADTVHTIVCVLWKEMHVVATAQNTLDQVLACSFTNNDASFATCGVDHVTFWTVVNNHYLRSQRGIFGRVAVMGTLTCVASAGDLKTLTGTRDGALIVWDDHHACQLITGHAATVTCAVYVIAVKQVVTASADGAIFIWRCQPSHRKEFLVKLARWQPVAPTSVVGLAATDDLTFAVTDDCTILELAPSCFEWIEPSTAPTPTQPQVLVQWHGQIMGTIGGLACHPTLDVIATSGADKTLRVWDLQTHLQLKSKALSAPANALAYSKVQDDKSRFHLAIALTTGSLVIVHDTTLDDVTTIECSKQACVDMKYSPCGKFLALACTDASIYVFAIDDSLAYAFHAKCEPQGTMNRHPITHLDFNFDSTILRSNALELQCAFWDVATGQHLEHSVSARETHWHTCTCPSTWSLLGANVRTASSLPTSCLLTPTFSSILPVVAMGDQDGHIHLIWYPCVEPSASKLYSGHASPVRWVRFTRHNRFLVSVGTYDRTLLVWTTDYAAEVNERRQAAASSPATTHHSYTSAKVHLTDERLLTDSGDRGEDKGDEFMAVKPWLGAIREPSNWTPKPDDAEAPQSSLELSFVYGYRGFDTRNNLSYGADTNTIVYHAAALGIVYDVQQHRQIFHYGHTDDIMCLAVHPEGHVVASGERGRMPKVILWDANSGSTLCVLSGFHQRGVSHVAFNCRGDLIATHGMDADHSLAIYNLQGKLVAKATASKQPILGMAFLDKDGISVGEKSVLFWSVSQTSLSVKKGSFGKGDSRGTVLCAVFVLGEAVTGQADGSLYQWKGRNCVSVFKGHEGAVNCMHYDATSKSVISGGKDGMIKFWGPSFDVLMQFDLKAGNGGRGGSIRSLSVDNGKLLFGTQACEICEVDISDLRKPVVPMRTYIEGHGGGELWGLGAHPEKQQFVTASDDGIVRLWDAPNRSCLAKLALHKKCRAVGLSPDGNHIAVGGMDGSVAILKGGLEGVVVELRVSIKAISVVKYSFDGKTLAVGSHDQRIYLYTAPAYSKRCVLRGHSSYITHLDFTLDSHSIQSNCGAYELLFWDVATGKQVTSANTLRDVKWHTWTCTLGWPVQGIWPERADGTDINGVCRSNSHKSVMTVDDNGHVNLFRYPCVQPHVRQLKFLHPLLTIACSVRSRSRGNTWATPPT